jgi:tetratricopeptide (TPR) repeat protein
MHAYEAQRLARVSGSLYGEAEAVRTQAACWKELGHYKKSLASTILAQRLLGLCGMSGSELELSIMTIQAEVHKCKSEYSEARKIHTEILQISKDRDARWHAYELLNVAEIEVLMGIQKHDVQQKIELAKSIYTVGSQVTVTCDAILGDLYLREKDLCAARLLFKKCLQIDLDAENKSLCLERLGDANQWGADDSMWQWTTVFLAYSLKYKQTLQVHKALQFFGDTFLHQKDEDTAITLFTVALEGFTYMDVHRSRADCMMRLGDISNSRGDLSKAVKLWNTARPLFERSSQLKDVTCVDKRLACVDSDVLEH